MIILIFLTKNWDSIKNNSYFCKFKKNFFLRHIIDNENYESANFQRDIEIK